MKENAGGPSNRVYPLTRQVVRTYKSLPLCQKSPKTCPANNTDIHSATEGHGESRLRICTRQIDNRARCAEGGGGVRNAEQRLNEGVKRVRLRAERRGVRAGPETGSD